MVLTYDWNNRSNITHLDNDIINHQFSFDEIQSDLYEPPQHINIYSNLRLLALNAIQGNKKRSLLNYKAMKALC